MPKHKHKQLPRPRVTSKQGQSLSIDAAFELARTAHQTSVARRSREGLSEVLRLYERILEQAPDHIGALQMIGMVSGQLGNAARAIEVLQRAAELSPSADVWSNIGMVLHNAGRAAEAENAWRKAITLEPGHSNAMSNLGTILKAQGRLQEAVALYKASIAANPQHAPSHHNLGNVLQRLGRTQEAITHFRTALELGESASRSLLGLAMWHSGDRDAATELFRDWLAREPDNQTAAHMLAAVTGENVPSRAADEYVTDLFDRFADTFDEHLVGGLDYRVPGLIGDRADAAYPERKKALAVLDVGCGTGLCGERLRQHAARLVGVDLSSAMLKRAGDTRAYDELAHGELTAYLEQNPAVFDLIVSADTFCYFGDLRPPFEAAARASRDGAALLFTVEAAAGEPANGFCLLPHGRYAHGAEYLERVLKETQWYEASIDHVVLRKERGEPVRGFLVLARKRQAGQA